MQLKSPHFFFSRTSHLLNAIYQVNSAFDPPWDDKMITFALSNTVIATVAVGEDDSRLHVDWLDLMLGSRLSLFCVHQMVG